MLFRSRGGTPLFAHFAFIGIKSLISFVKHLTLYTLNVLSDAALRPLTHTQGAVAYNQHCKSCAILLLAGILDRLSNATQGAGQTPHYCLSSTDKRDSRSLRSRSY